jgi:hypothetical protein
MGEKVIVDALETFRNDDSRVTRKIGNDVHGIVVGNYKWCAVHVSATQLSKVNVPPQPQTPQQEFSSEPRNIFLSSQEFFGDIEDVVPGLRSSSLPQFQESFNKWYTQSAAIIFTELEQIVSNARWALPQPKVEIETQTRVRSAIQTMLVKACQLAQAALFEMDRDHDNNARELLLQAPQILFDEMPPDLIPSEYLSKEPSPRPPPQLAEGMRTAPPIVPQESLQPKESTQTMPVFTPLQTPETPQLTQSPSLSSLSFHDPFALIGGGLSKKMPSKDEFDTVNGGTYIWTHIP